MENNIQYYPLTAAQRVLVFELKYCPFAQIVNVTFEIEFEEQMNPELLCRAMVIVLKGDQASHIRLHNDGKEVRQYFSEEETSEVKYLDFSKKSSAVYENQLLRWSKKPFPNKHMDTCLYRIYAVRKPSGKHGIYGCFSHLISDMFGISSLNKRILSVYQALVNDTEIPDVSTNLLEVYDKEFKYTASERCVRDVEYFDRTLYETEPQYTSFNGSSSKEFSRETKYGSFCISPLMKGEMLDLPVDMKINEQVSEFSSLNKISSQACYLLAVRTWLASGCGVNDVTFTNVVLRRSTLAQKKAGGTMANGILFRTVIDRYQTFIEGCNNVYSTLLDTYRHADIDAGKVVGMGYEKFGTPKLKTYSGMGFSYCDFPLSSDNSIPMKFRRIPVGKETLAMYCTLMPCDTYGNLSVNYSFLKGIISAERVKSFHKFLMEFLKYGTEHPEESIEAITDKVLGKR